MRTSLRPASSCAFAGCGGGDDDKVASVPTVTSSTQRLTAAPEQIAAGRRAVTDAGCRAFHQIGPRGNSGPGSNLAGIGDRMAPSAIRRRLLNAPGADAVLPAASAGPPPGARRVPVLAARLSRAAATTTAADARAAPTRRELRRRGFGMHVAPNPPRRPAG
jgi:hypothetical protein